MPIANIKVVGIGGGGGNAISRMRRDFMRGVEFIAINTDHQDLDHCDIPKKIYIGRNLTRGMGTGMNPELGRQAVEENRSEIAEALRGADLVFLSAGLGGGTGTGGAPIVAEAAKQSGALTIGVVTKPFAFEGKERERVAQEGLIKLKDKVDALIVVPNDRIFSVISKDTPIVKAFEAVDDILRNALHGIVEIIATPGIINVDFADVRNIVENAGLAIVGLGVASGPERAVNAVNQALNSPLLETGADGARGVLLGISGGRDMRMNEINEAAKLVSQVADPTARIIFGAYYDRSLRPNQLKVTIIATGFNGISSANSLFYSHNHAGETKPTFSGMNGFNKTKGGEGPSKTAKENLPPKKEEADVRQNGESAAYKTAAKDKTEERSASAKKESDVWDIPTFLRRRKK